MRSFVVFCIFSAFTSTLIAATPQFQPRQDIATGFQHLNSLAFADFNGDGKLDIAAIDSTDKRVVVYLNNGIGTAMSPVSTTLSLSSNTQGTMVAGDFNEDGKQDLIVGTFSGEVDYLSGNGDGTFTKQSTLTSFYAVASAVVADINHDSHLDIIGGGNGAVYASLGDGHGNFQTQSFTNQGPGSLYSALAAGDFNKDGKIDFASASPVPAQSSGVRYFLGNNDGSFSAPVLLTNKSTIVPQFIVTADFNGDGATDVLIGSEALSSVILSNGDGTFSTNSYDLFPPPPLGSRIAHSTPVVAAADIDGDKKMDVLEADDDSRAVSVFLNDGTGTFRQAAPEFTTAVDAKTSTLRTADLNGDGLPDIIIGNATTNNITIFYSIRPKSAPAITLTASVNPQLVGSLVIFTAKIIGVTSNVPTGTVTLLDGANSVGQQTLDASAQAAFSFSNLSAGQHSLTISYSGDNNFLSVTSTAITQNIADFQIALPTTSQTVTAGGTATYSLTLTPTGGLTGSLSITCSQLPSLASCDPVAVSITGQPVSATVTVRTTASITSRHVSSIRTASLGLISIALTGLLTLRRRKPIQLFVVAFALMIAGSIVGCSSGSNSTSKPTVTPGTPQGTTPFTITSTITLGGQTLARTTTANLVVQ